MSYRLAKSLQKLRDQLNAVFPARSKISDGWIGDAKHASRKSDHNPWVKDSNGLGVVTAFDFTNDPKNGIDCNLLAEALRNSRDPRIKYVIWNSRIFSSVVSAWAWRRYSGSNKHTKHLHISVNSSAGLYDNTKDWIIPNSNGDIDQAIDNAFDLFSSTREIEIGDRGEAVRQLQEKLSTLGYLKKSDIDSDFGPKTQSAVQFFQSDNNLRADGIVGANTKATILKELGKQKTSAAGPVEKPTSEPKTEKPDTVEGSKPSSEKSETSSNNQSHSDPPPNNQPKIAIEKPEPKGFISTIRGEISAIVAGNGGVQAGIDYAQQVTAFGLSYKFWTTLGVIIFAGSIIYLVYRWFDFRQDAKRDLDITNKLIDVNSTANNQVYLVDRKHIGGLDQSEFEVIRR